MAKKRVRARVPKAKRRNLKLWAEGARESILSPHIEDYADSIERGWRFERECFQRISNEFHARIDWRLKDAEEPALPLPDFDPKAPLPELERLSDAEEQERQQRMDMLDARIRRWLKYRVKRLRKHVQTKINSDKDPWAILLAKLSGVTAPPKARQGYQQFMRESYAQLDCPIEAVVKERWAETAAEGSSVATSKEPNAPFRAKVLRELFAALPQSEQEDYKERAKAEAVAARAAYDKSLKEEPGKTPQARQAAIDTLGSFVAPILQGIFDRTGLHTVLLLGGPIPKYGGDLRTIHVSFGRNRSAAKSHFPLWDQPRFNSVLGLMKEYLETAFNKADCAATALPTGLEGAKFTIDEESESESDSDSNASLESSGDEESDDEEKPPRKKKKGAAKAKAKETRAEKSAPTPAQVADANRLAYARMKENERQANIAQNKALLQPLVDGHNADKERWRLEDAEKKKNAAEKGKKSAERKRKAPAEAGPTAPRKSRRLAKDGSASTATEDENTLPVVNAGGTQAPLRPADPSAASGSLLPVVITPANTPGLPTGADAGAKPPTASIITEGADATASTLPVDPGDASPVNDALTPPALPAGAAPVDPGDASPVNEALTPPALAAGAADAPVDPGDASPVNEALTPPALAAGAADAPVDPGDASPVNDAITPPALAAGAADATLHTVTEGAPPINEPRIPPPPPAGAPDASASAKPPTPLTDPGDASPEPLIPSPEGGAAVKSSGAAIPKKQKGVRGSMPSRDDLRAGVAAHAFDFGPEAPTWLRESVRVLLHVDLGCHYRSLVETLIRVECKLGFDENPQTGVSGEARPAEVSRWIKSGRGIRQKGPYDAGITDLRDYADRWWGWWDSLQPVWRKRARDNKWESGGNTQMIVIGTRSGSLARTGEGGWDDDNREEWERAVADVVWILEGLEQAVPAPKKKRARAT
ncbi:hypothetical protein B0H13DRAFT_2367460 [Mycena leptocephala]|nr:hypothetical protein B0H13DRAFT_2367460 [Mycena leptocephala]